MGDSAAASESRSEVCLGGASTGEVFAFEDLLDFSNDQVGDGDGDQEEEEEELREDEFGKGNPTRCCPLLEAPDSVVSSSSSSDNTAAAATCDADLVGAAGLCPVPYEELNAELEWVSGHLDEDEPVLSLEDAEKLRLISGSGASTNPPPSYASPSSSSSTLTSFPSSSSTSSGDRCSSSSYSTSSNDNNTLHQHHQHLRLINDDEYALLDPDVVDDDDDAIDAEFTAAALAEHLHPLPSRGARSKRARADPCSLASRLAVLLTSTATTAAADAAELGVLHPNFSTCSSSSSYNTINSVPFDTHRKKPTKVIVKPPSNKTITTKPVVPQRQPPPRYYAAHDEPLRRCLHCATDQTPQWRAGPMGPKTLCNACGVRYKSGRLVPEYRPAASPTFVMSKHSNSHRKVMELRRQKESHHTMQLHQTGDGDGGDVRRSTAHMFPLPAGDDIYAAAGTAPPGDFLMHHSVGPDFRHLI